MKYDFLIIGAGLYGAVFAREAMDHGKKVLVIDKRPHIAGNIHTEKIDGILVHRYGAHIFHTNSPAIWNYVNRFASFNRFTNAPVANCRGELFSLPFNMYTFNKMWGVITPDEAAAKIDEQRKEITGEPQNLEEQAISLVGRDIYEKLIKGYTEKQWGRSCTELPPFIIRRLPVRFTFDTNYFNSLYQGIPIRGYTDMVARMLSGAEIRLNEDYLADRCSFDSLADRIIYTGPLDALRMNFSPSEIIRETPSSITQTGIFPLPASSSINGLNSEKMKTVMTFPPPLSAGNIRPNGSPVTNLITRSTTERTTISPRHTESLLFRNPA